MDGNQMDKDSNFIPPCKSVRVKWSERKVDHEECLYGCQDFVENIYIEDLIFFYSILVNQFH